MAQKDQELIHRRAPFVDLIVGPGQLQQIPQLIREIEAGGGRQIEVSLGRKEGSRDQVARSHESFDPLRDPSLRPALLIETESAIHSVDAFVVPGVSLPS